MSNTNKDDIIKEDNELHVHLEREATKEVIGDNEILWVDVYGLHLALHVGKNIKADKVFDLIKKKIVQMKGEKINVLTSHPLLTEKQEDLLWNIREYVNRQ